MIRRILTIPLSFILLFVLSYAVSAWGPDGRHYTDTTRPDGASGAPTGTSDAQRGFRIGDVVCVDFTACYIATGVTIEGATWNPMSGQTAFTFPKESCAAGEILEDTAGDGVLVCAAQTGGSGAGGGASIFGADDGNIQTDAGATEYWIIGAGEVNTSISGDESGVTWTISTDSGGSVYGSLFSSGVSEIIQIPVADTNHRLSVFDQEGPSSGTTPNASDDQIEIGSDGVYLGLIGLSFNGTNNSTYGVHIFETSSGTSRTFDCIGFQRKIGTANDVGSALASGITVLRKGDLMEAQVHIIDGTGEIDRALRI